MLLAKLFSSRTPHLPLLSLSLIFGLGVAVANPTPVLANSRETPTVSQLRLPVTVLAQKDEPISLLADGIYLYGQSPKPEQIGQEYLVFKVEKGKVIGAVYLPQSEFSCFSGSFDSQQMNLSVIDPYDNTVSSYSIALESSSPVATNGKVSRNIGLEGYHPINTISNNDRRILNVCLQEKN